MRRFLPDNVLVQEPEPGLAVRPGAMRRFLSDNVLDSHCRRLPATDMAIG